MSAHIGQAGAQLGNMCWELYCLEHDLDEAGRLMKEESSTIRIPELSSMVGDSNGIPEGFGSFFCETVTGNFCPRAIFVDMDPTVIGKDNRCENKFNSREWRFTTSMNENSRNHIHYFP